MKWQLKSKPAILLVGLGNPGPDYTETRHNVGFKMIELLAEQLNLSVRKAFFHPCRWWVFEDDSHKLILVEPLTFMNRSGDVFPWLMKKFRVSPDSIIVLVDNMDLPPGTIRMKPKGSSAGHNGLKSIISRLGTGDFHRIYLGIGRPQHQRVVDHVLGVPDKEEKESMQSAYQKLLPLLLRLGKINLKELRDAIQRL